MVREVYQELNIVQAVCNWSHFLQTNIYKGKKQQKEPIEINVKINQSLMKENGKFQTHFWNLLFAIEELSGLKVVDVVYFADH